MKYREAQARSIVKTIGYRILIIISNAIIVFVLTRNFALTLGSSAIMAVANTIIYYFYERFWNAVSWGKKVKK